MGGSGIVILANFGFVLLVIVSCSLLILLCIGCGNVLSFSRIYPLFILLYINRVQLIVVNISNKIVDKSCCGNVPLLNRICLLDHLLCIDVVQPNCGQLIVSILSEF